MNIAAVISAVDQISGVIGRIMGAIGQLAHGISSILGRAFDILSGIVGKVFGLVRDLAEKMLRVFTMGGAIGGAVSIAGLTMLGKRALDTAAMFEVLRAQMETAFGSKAKGGEMFAWAVEFAAKTPFDVPQIVEATTLLKLFGLEAKKWLPLVGDMAGAMGKDVTQATQAVANSLMGEQEMLKQFGINWQTLVQHGARPSETGRGVDTGDRAGIESALESIITERFGGGMGRMFQTVQGVLSNIGDAIKTAFNKVGEPLADIVKWIGEDVMRIVTALGEKLAPVVRALAPLFGQAATNLLNFAVEGINRLPRLAELFEKLVAILLPMQQVLGAKMADALGRALDWLLDKVEGLIDGFGKLNKGDLLNTMADAVGGVLLKIGGWFQTFGAWLQNEFPTYFIAAMTVFTALGDVIITVLAGIQSAVGSVMGSITGTLGNFAKGMSVFLTSVGAKKTGAAWGEAGKDLTGAGDALKTLGQSTAWADTLRTAMTDAVGAAMLPALKGADWVGAQMAGAGQAVSGWGTGLQNWDPSLGGGVVPEARTGRGGRAVQTAPYPRVAVTVQQGDGVKAEVQRTARVQASMKNLKLGLAQ